VSTCKSHNIDMVSSNQPLAAQFCIFDTNMLLSGILCGKMIYPDNKGYFRNATNFT
jgi:hypothetical protein